MSEFFTQATNLLAQQLAGIKGEEIYALTACMDPEYRQAIGAILGIQEIKPEIGPAVKKIMPILANLGKAAWVRSELTDLGLRVGQRNIEEIRDEETVDDK